MKMNLEEMGEYADELVKAFKDEDAGISPAEALSICVLTMMKIIVEVDDVTEREAIRKMHDTLSGILKNNPILQ